MERIGRTLLAFAAAPLAGCVNVAAPERPIEINLDGALDGEFLTRINMDGLARNPAVARRPSGGLSGMVVGRVLGQLARVPFHFNIRIQGRFRALIATARSFEDPSELIRASLPQLLERQTSPEPSVQPQESEPVR